MSRSSPPGRVSAALPTHAPDAARRPLVAVFDSGVGGLTILAAVRRVCPGARFVYTCDNANFPYGPRAEEDVTECVRVATARLLAAHAPDVLVVACNTASTVALPHLRAGFRVPVVGVVPAIKPAAERTRTGIIGLLATPGTVTRPYVSRLIEDFARGVTVVRVGSARLVQLAEDKARGRAVDLDALRRELAPMFAPLAGGDGGSGGGDVGARPAHDATRRLDTVVLGCTHFPLLADELAAAAAWPVTWIDSGDAIAARVRAVLVDAGVPERRLDTPGDVPAADARRERFTVTRLDDDARALAPMLPAFGFTRVEALDADGPADARP